MWLILGSYVIWSFTFFPVPQRNAMQQVLSPSPSSSSSSSAVVTKLSSLLGQGPLHFEITILPGRSTSPASDSASSSQPLLSLEDSLSLVEGRYLGLDARSLPWMTHEIRRAYKLLKKQTMDAVAVAVADDNENADAYHGDNKTMARTSTMIQTTACLLLVNPDHATAWADRRRCLLRIMVDQSAEDPSIFWRKELEFVNLLMTQHSKAPFSWAHRKYVLQQILNCHKGDYAVSHGNHCTRDDETRDRIISLFRDEVRVCREVAERYPKNYYAWTHRRFFLGKVVVNDPMTTRAIDDNVLDLLQEEWDDTVTGWLNLHVSDHSAVHYASQILEMCTVLLLKAPSVPGNNSSSLLKQLATKVLSQVRSLIERNEESRETPWILRRMVITILLKTKVSSIELLVREEVRSIAVPYYLQKRHDDDGHDSGPFSSVVDVHALTFLAWVMRMVQQDDDGVNQIDSSWLNVDMQNDDPGSLYSLLRNHPQIYHCMWMERP